VSPVSTMHLRFSMGGALFRGAAVPVSLPTDLKLFDFRFDDNATHRFISMMISTSQHRKISPNRHHVSISLLRTRTLKLQQMIPACRCIVLRRDHLVWRWGCCGSRTARRITSFEKNQRDLAVPRTRRPAPNTLTSLFLFDQPTSMLNQLSASGTSTSRVRRRIRRLRGFSFKTSA